ncbi:MAG: Asp-tRNA(Asn)/Glu-tRNA(Gln) amidotransferase subunit GatC [Candidatus Yanofskybacteria bacterium]|nr:Asp-tRNA(Asn)/Glu-tRNA(Gln) amidotransferase subunit GatC [Candidatus Yanofskybacteria bacterium]
MITEKEVEHIAQLARLELNEKEKTKFQKELSLILDYVAKLKELDVSQVEPTISGSGTANVMRSDQAVGTYGPEMSAKILEQAPDEKKGFVKVKSILMTNDPEQIASQFNGAGKLNPKSK